MTSINIDRHAFRDKDKTRPLRVLFLGTRCEFSGIVFSGLVQRSTRASGSIEPAIDLCAALLYLPGKVPYHISRSKNGTELFRGAIPGQDDNKESYPRPRLNTNSINELPLFDAHRPPDIFQLAQAQSIPTYEIGVLDDPKLTTLIDSFAVDIICVACYPKRVPQKLLALPTYGCLNVHPSLLPAYRGPDPLFWIMRDGAQSSAGGVTIHWMDAEWDNGPIAAQQTLAIPDGVSGPAANRLCAEAGSRLLGEVLAKLSQHQRDPNAMPNVIDDLSQPQPTGGRYQSWPQEIDYLLDLSWSAQRAFNFMRGTKSWRQPHLVLIDGETIVLRDALAVDMERRLTVPFVRGNGTVQIQFSTGVLHASA